MPVYDSLTGADLIVLLADRVGDLKATGTASSGDTSSIIDTNPLSGFAKFTTANDPELVDALAFIYKGTNAGAQRAISAFSESALDATVAPVFASAIDNTSKYAVIGRWDGAQYLEALKQAQRMLTWDPRLSRGILSKSVVEEIVYGNVLRNGAMFRWTNGTSSAPDNWTLAGTGAAVAQQATEAAAGLYAARLTSDGTNAAYLHQQITPLGRWRGRNIRALALFKADVADRASVRIGQGTAGSITTIGSAVTAGTAGVWKWADISQAFDTAVSSAPPTSLTLQFGISAGSAVDCDCAFGFIEDPEPRDEYDIDADGSFVVLDGTLYVSRPVWENTDGALAFPRFIGPEAWRVVHDSTRRIKLNVGRGQIPLGSIIRYTGYAEHTALSAITDTWAGPIDAILDLAAVILEAQKVSPQQTPSLRRAGNPNGAPSYGSIEAIRRDILMRDGIFVPNAKRVENII